MVTAGASVPAFNSDRSVEHKPMSGTIGAVSSSSLVSTGMETHGLKSRTCTGGPLP